MSEEYKLNKQQISETVGEVNFGSSFHGAGPQWQSKASWSLQGGHE